jgi:hypothetical protein
MHGTRIATLRSQKRTPLPPSIERLGTMLASFGPSTMPVVAPVSALQLQIAASLLALVYRKGN